MTMREPTAQDTMGRRMLYVLGFGLAGAIVANIVVLAYLTSFHASC